ncbi:hypothetical protein HELRODRAFT_189525 [Helobdella robusta]|uniref:Claspin n=1 Tax=Helobdella robusta TaxID=6412 RepID=T1FR47_HELRO|nr:hypothetical protein HELRODRAFT_189525 [Helobdella robusta]ESN92604.1 hypothetical protein HELRODRAFT_189525 [Helobdella robusta]
MKKKSYDPFDEDALPLGQINAENHKIKLSPRPFKELSSQKNRGANDGEEEENSNNNNNNRRDYDNDVYERGFDNDDIDKDCNTNISFSLFHDSKSERSFESACLPSTGKDNDMAYNDLICSMIPAGQKIRNKKLPKNLNSDDDDDNAASSVSIFTQQRTKYREDDDDDSKFASPDGNDVVDDVIDDGGRFCSTSQLLGTDSMAGQDFNSQLLVDWLMDPDKSKRTSFKSAIDDLCTKDSKTAGSNKMAGNCDEEDELLQFCSGTFTTQKTDDQTNCATAADANDEDDGGDDDDGGCTGNDVDYDRDDDGVVAGDNGRNKPSKELDRMSSYDLFSSSSSFLPSFSSMVPDDKYDDEDDDAAKDYDDDIAKHYDNEKAKEYANKVAKDYANEMAKVNANEVASDGNNNNKKNTNDDDGGGDDEKNDGEEAAIKKKRKRIITDSDEEEEEVEEDDDVIKDEDDVIRDNDVGCGGGDDDDDVEGGKMEESKEAVKLPSIGKKGIIDRQFIEEEAELSDSENERGKDDDDDDEEDDEDNDVMEREEGDDDDVGTEEELRKQVQKAHLKMEIDQDKRELRLLQEHLLEDGDLYDEGIGRIRRFRWNNTEQYDGDDANDGWSGAGGGGDDDDGGGADDDDEVKWRINRLEREKFLQKHQDLKKVGSFLHRPKDTLAKYSVDPSRKGSTNGHNDKKGGPLGGAGSGCTNSGTLVSRNSRNFVFSTISTHNENSNNSCSGFEFKGTEKSNAQPKKKQRRIRLDSPLPDNNSNSSSFKMFKCIDESSQF